MKYKVRIVETYTRDEIVEAESQEEAREKVNDMVNCGEIDIPCDGGKYDYNLDLYTKEMEEIKPMSKVWTFFVLDMDATYSIEEENSTGVVPSVYLIPLERQLEVESLALKASEDFLKDTENDYCFCIGDYFEGYLKERNIPFKYVGDVDLTFGERQVDYLADYIPRAVV